MRELEEGVMEQTVYIVDDDVEIIEAIESLLASISITTKSYTCAESFLREYEQQPGCLILDIRIKKMSGLQLQQALIDGNYIIPVIFITGHGDIPMTKRALLAGARDFFIKPFNNQELLDSIQLVLRQNRMEYAEHVKTMEMEKRFASLSPREQETLSNISNGQPNKVIAANLQISMSTIEAHRAKIMRKMGVENFAALMKIVVKYNLVET